MSTVKADDLLTPVSLGATAARAVRWSAVSQYGQQAIQLVATGVLAHLLPPSDFGLMGMAAVFAGLAALLGDMGTATALVQRPQVDNRLLSTVFWTNAGVGTIVAVAAALASPFAALLAGEPRVAALLQVLSLAYVLSSMVSVQRALLQRGLRFGELAQVELTAMIIGCITGVAMALLGLGVWSLVCQSLASALCSTLLLFGITGWAPSLEFDWLALRSVARFSLNLTGFNVVNYGSRNVDNFLVGRYLGGEQLGYYAMAYKLMIYPVTGLASVVGRVLLPAFSQLQDDASRLGKAYIRVVGHISVVAFPAMLCAMVLADPSVRLLLGLRWQPIVPLLVILAPVGMVQSIGAPVGNLFVAKGRTDWLFRVGVASSLLVTAAFVFGLRWGVYGVAATYAAVSALLAVATYLMAIRLVQAPATALAAALWRPLLCGTATALVLRMLVRALASNAAHVPGYMLLVSCALVTYGGLSWVLNRDQVRDVAATAMLRR